MRHTFARSTTTPRSAINLRELAVANGVFAVPADALQSRTRLTFSSGVEMDWVHQQIKMCITEKKAIIVVGAGVSIAVTGSTDASWRGLLKMGIERCAYVGDPRPDPRWKPIMLKLLQIGDIEDWLLIAEEIQLRLRGGELRTWLADWSVGLQIKNDAIIRCIHALGLQIMTTNYDSLIEHVTGRKAITLDKEYEHELMEAEQSSDKYVLHLHGHHDESSNFTARQPSTARLRGRCRCRRDPG